MMKKKKKKTKQEVLEPALRYIKVYFHTRSHMHNFNSSFLIVWDWKLDRFSTTAVILSVERNNHFNKYLSVLWGLSPHKSLTLCLMSLISPPLRNLHVFHHTALIVGLKMKSTMISDSLIKSAHLFKSYRRVRWGTLIPRDENVALLLSGCRKRSLPIFRHHRFIITLRTYWYIWSYLPVW
jgi:hypothetical protein